MAKGNFIEYVVSDNPNKYPNDGERGMTSYIESTTIGIQINYSSRFVNPNGEILPCTLTFTNFRYEKL